MLEYVQWFVISVLFIPCQLLLVYYGKNDYFTIFIETEPLSCSDNYVDLHQPLICVAHDTNPLVLPASIMRCLFTYTCRPNVDFQCDAPSPPITLKDGRSVPSPPLSWFVYGPVNDSSVDIWQITLEWMLTEEPILVYHALRSRLTVDKIFV